MATQNQQTAFRKVIDKITRGEKVEMKTILLDSGYSTNTANKPKDVTGSVGWTELLATIDTAPLLAQLYSIALDGKDKRSAITAIQELLKLQDRYPVSKTKIELGLEQRHKYLKQPDLDHYIEVKDEHG